MQERAQLQDTLNDDVEVKVIQEERADFVKKLPGLIVVLACMTLNAETCMCGFISIAMTVLGVCPTLMMTFSTNRESVLNQYCTAQLSGAVVRTAIHILWIIMHPEHEFMKLLCLFAFPISLAAQFGNIRVYIVYLILHNSLTIYRFWGHLQGSLPFICIVLVMSMLGMESVSQKRRGISMRLLLHDMLRQMTEISQTTVCSLLDVFCDAVVAMDKNLNLLRSSPGLSTLLSRQAQKGRSFEDLVDMSDREELRSQVASILGHVVVRPKIGETDEHDEQSSSIQLQSFQIHLRDAYSVAVPVHLFYIYQKRHDNDIVLLVGISESWAPKASSKEKGNSSRRINSQLRQLCMKTGKLVPTTPAFPTDITEVTRKLKESADSVKPRRRVNSPSSSSSSSPARSLVKSMESIVPVILK